MLLQMNAVNAPFLQLSDDEAAVLQLDTGIFAVYASVFSRLHVITAASFIVVCDLFGWTPLLLLLHDVKVTFLQFKRL